MSLNKFASSIQPDTWNNITVTVNKTSGDVKFSMNNKVETTTADLSNMNLGGNLLVGAENNTIFTKTLKGGVDDVRVYNEAITDEQIEDEIQTFDLLKIKDGEDMSSFSNSISTTNGATFSGETITFDGSSTVEVDGTTLDGYNLNQFTFKTHVNPSNTNGGVLMRKELEYNGFIEVRLNAENKLEIEISDKPVYDVSATLVDSAVTVSGKTTTNEGTTPTIYSVAYTTPQADKSAIYNDISYFTDETPISITGLDSTKYSTIQPSNLGESNVEINVGGTTMTATINSEIDYDETKTPWILVANFLHLGGTNPSNNIKTVSSGLPYLPDGNTLQLFKDGDGLTTGYFDRTLLGTTDGSTDLNSWGSTGLTLFDELCVALGSATGTDGTDVGLELRWAAIGGNGGSNTIHFTSPGNIDYFRTGTGGNYLEIKNDFTALIEHQGVLPDNAESGHNSGGGGSHLQISLVAEPYRSNGYSGVYGVGSNVHWNSRNGRWEVNDGYETNTGYEHNTYHQIWVRATINDTMSQEMKTALTPPVTTPIYQTPKDIVSVQEGAAAASASASSTEYNVEIPVDGTTMTATVNAEIDADPTKTPWILVCNYINRGGDSPQPTSQSSGRMLTELIPYLPIDGSLSYENLDVTDLSGSYPSGYFDTEYSYTWGHTNTTMFTKLCSALGDSGLQVRFRAKSSLHNRQIHFKTRDDSTNIITIGVFSEFKNGTYSTTQTLNQGTDPLVDLYDDHTTSTIPSTEGNTIYWAYMGGSSVETTMTDGIFRNIGNDKYWRINEGNSMFAVDDHVHYYSGSVVYNTYHQIWVRADLATCTQEMKAALFPVTTATPIHNLTKVLERTSPSTNPSDLNSYGIAGVTNNVYVYTVGLTGDINSLMSGSNTEPYAISENRVQVVAGEDFSILAAANAVSESNALTTDLSVSFSGGYENYWAFVVKNSDAIDLSDTNTDLKVQLETFIEQYIEIGIAGGFYDTLSNALYTGTKRYDYNVIVSGTYYFSGDATGSQPTLNVYPGDILSFHVDVSGHPFHIKTVQETGISNQAPGVVNNGNSSGIVRWTPTTTGTYYYQCEDHPDMYGTITVSQRPPAFVQGAVFEYAFDSLTSVTPTAMDTDANTYTPVTVVMGSDGKYVASYKKDISLIETNVQLPVLGDGTTMTATVNTEIDADPTKTPWILVLNYQHASGTEPPPTVRTTSSGLPYLPEDNTMQLFKDGSFDATKVGPNDSGNTTTSWGHAGNALFNKVCEALGSASNSDGSDAGLELKWTGISSERTSDTSIHFVSNGGFVYFRTGSGSAISEILSSSPEHLPGGTIGKCPEICTSGYSNEGDYAFTDFPYYLDASATNRYHWSTGAATTNGASGSGQYWSVNDTFNSSPNHDTYHQIWVRADLATCPDEMKAALYPTSTISQSLSWTPAVSETAVTRIVVEDVVSASNVMTIGNGFVASTSTITKYWAFAVKNSDAVDFSDTNTELTTQIETFVEQYLDFGITNNLFTSYTNSYHSGTSQKVFSLAGSAFEHAFDSLTSVIPTALDTEANTYQPVVVVMGSDGKYYLTSEFEPPFEGITILVKDVDWSQEVANTPDHNLSSSTFTGDTHGNYGRSCSISADGTTALISGHDTTSSGCAFIWTKDESGTWTQTANLSKSSNAKGYYGYFCSISKDGTTALISGFIDTDSGGAWIWHKNDDGTWPTAPTADLSMSSDTNGYYGHSCSISGDGTTALVAGYSSTSSGGAWIWQKNDDGSWPTTPTADLSKTSGTNGSYGMTCSISADGNTALISGDSSTSAGGAWIWQKNDDGSWPTTPTADLSKTSGTNGRYGRSCSISADGTTVLVSGHNNTSSGGAFIWKRNEDGTWPTTPTADLSKTSGTKGYYGNQCSLSADGTTALISGQNTTTSSGGAWTWQKNDDGTWPTTPTSDLSKSSGTNGYYGKSCSISADGTTVLISGENTTTAGGAWIWEGVDNGVKNTVLIGDVIPPISQSLSWTPAVSETAVTRIVVDDVVSASNVMTIGNGFVASTSPITKYWAFAVKNSDAVDFSDTNTELTTQIETFVEQYLDFGITNNLFTSYTNSYQQGAGQTVVSLVGSAFEYAFDSLTSVTPTALDTEANTYTPVVVVMGSDGKYYLTAEFEPPFEGITILVKDVDWSQEVSNTPDHNLSKTSGANGQYGQSCSISADGTTALIAGKYNTSAGGAWIWTKDESGTWTQTADLSKTSGANGTYGMSCSISADGTVALVAGWSSISAGGAWIWQKNDDGTWPTTPTSDLSKTSGANGYYGHSCSISGDGTTALIAGYSTGSSGGAWIWQKNDDGTWPTTPTADLSKTSGTNGNYGRTCSISGDGTTVLIVGYLNASSGGAWIWTKDESGTWIETGDLSKTSGAYGHYGQSCSISTDGTTALIVGYVSNSSGGAYIWTKDESGIWTETADLSMSSGANGHYGQSCSISADGRIALVSGYFNGSSGGAWIWTKDESGTWTTTADLSKPSGAGGLYGHSCSISANGTTALVAGYKNTSSGGAWIWEGVDNGVKNTVLIGDVIPPISQSLSWTPAVTQTGVTHSIITTTLEVVNDAVIIPYTIATTTTVVKHYVALFESDAVTDKTDVELLTTVQGVATVSGNTGALVSDTSYSAGSHSETVTMTFAINANGGATAVNIGTGYVVKVFTMNDGWETGGLGTTTNVPYDRSKTLATQLSDMGLDYTSDVGHHFDASGATASTTVITDGISGTITTSNVTFGNDGEFGYFKQSASNLITTLSSYSIPNEWTHVLVIKPNTGGYDGSINITDNSRYNIHIGNSEGLRIYYTGGTIGISRSSGILADGTFLNYIGIYCWTFNRTTNTGKYWFKWNNGTSEIFETNTETVDVDATSFYYGRSWIHYAGNIYELSFINKYFSDDTELETLGNYFYYKYYGGGPDLQSTTTNPSINVLTKEIPYIPQEFEWISVKITSIDNTGTHTRATELALYSTKYTTELQTSTSLPIERDTSENITVRSGTYTGSYTNANLIHNGNLGSNSTQQFNNVTEDAYNIPFSYEYKLSTPVSGFVQMLIGSTTDHSGFPHILEIYGGNTYEEARDQTNLMQTIDISYKVYPSPASSGTSDSLYNHIFNLNESTGNWEDDTTYSGKY